MKNFKVVFSAYEQYVENWFNTNRAGFSGLRKSDWKILHENKEEGWKTYEVITNLINTDEWPRKGSIGINGFLIHDDYRLDGDCRLFVNIKNEWVELENLIG